MTRETIATDLLSSLAPILASLLVALASLPALEAIRAGLAPRVLRVRRISQPQTGLGLATPRRALPRRRLAEPRSRVRRDETTAVLGVPPLAVRWLKARPS